MEILNSPSVVTENTVKCYPFGKKQAPSINSHNPSSQCVPSRSISSPGAFPQSALKLAQTVDTPQNNSVQRLEKPRVVSFPEHIYPLQRVQAKSTGNPLNPCIVEGIIPSDEYNSSDDSIEFTMNPNFHSTRAFPSVLNFDTPSGKNKPKLPGDEDWITASPRPIPALHGPASLPYARCPSGAEGTVIEEPSSLPHIIWGLEPDYMFGFQQSRNIRKNYQKRPRAHRNSIYSISEQVFGHQENIRINYSDYLTPPIETPIIHSNHPSRTVLEASEENSDSLKNPIQLESRISDRRLIDEAAHSYHETGLGLKSCFVSSFGPKEQALLKDATHLPTPPSSSSPQWKTKFSPIIDHSFLIPLSGYDTACSSTDYTHTFGLGANTDYYSSDFATNVSAPLPALHTYTSSEMPDSHTHRIFSSFCGNRETVVGTSRLSQLATSYVDYHPEIMSTVDNTQLQTQTVEEYFNSEEENPLRKVVVSLPEKVESRRCHPSIDAKFKIDGRTVHPSKLGIMSIPRRKKIFQ